MIKAKFIFFAVVVVMFLVSTSASSQEIKEGNAFDSPPDYFMFGCHSEGKIYGSDRSIEYANMQDMIERYSTPSKWVNKVVKNTQEIVIAFEGYRCSFGEQDYEKPIPPSYISVYYTDEHEQFRLLRVHFGKGSYERLLGRYKIRVSAKESSIYEGKTLVYRMKTPSNS